MQPWCSDQSMASGELFNKRTTITFPVLKFRQFPRTHSWRMFFRGDASNVVVDREPECEVTGVRMKHFIKTQVIHVMTKLVMEYVKKGNVLQFANHRINDNDVTHIESLDWVKIRGRSVFFFLLFCCPGFTRIHC